tara:strand:- start:425 stop:694 length:270 start_codon:yes stop_codon:yes gene_type:complete
MSSVRQKMAATQKAQNKAEEQARLGVEAVAPVVEALPEESKTEKTEKLEAKPAPKKAAPKKAPAKKAAAPKKAPAKKKTTTSPAPKGKK